MKHSHRWVSFVFCLGLGVLLSYGCGKDDKNPMNTGGGGGGGGTGTPDVLVSITGIMGGSSYSPNPVNVSAGQLIAWKNNDPGTTSHSATQDGGGGFDTGVLSKGAQSDTIRFNTAGDFPYHCSVHGSSMTGTVHVTP